MTRLPNVLAFCALAAPLVVAAQTDAPAGAEHSQHEQHAAQSGAAAGNQSAGMHEHMQEMREQMARIRATQDAGERERLMHEHMQSMQQHMLMMGSMQADNGMTPERLRGLEDRLASIEQLLQQISEHQRVEGAQNAESRRERDRSR